jgi:hypothetical protein
MVLKATGAGLSSGTLAPVTFIPLKASSIPLTLADYHSDGSAIKRESGRPAPTVMVNGYSLRLRRPKRHAPQLPDGLRNRRKSP